MNCVLLPWLSIKRMAKNNNLIIHFGKFATHKEQWYRTKIGQKKHRFSSVSTSLHIHIRKFSEVSNNSSTHRVSFSAEQFEFRTYFDVQKQNTCDWL